MSLQYIQRVKILGAGSIGNHLAHASRQLGCEVVVCDISSDALERMRSDIYPSRYGAWDTGIELSLVDQMPKGGFDLICIGTPPEFHVRLALDALTERPRALQIEKPLCLPDLTGAADLVEAQQDDTKVFIGYDHVVGNGAKVLEQVIREGTIGNITTFDVQFREHWGDIFNAHPWLTGPADSYLGYWLRGGGASGEHSHAINFWQHVSHLVGAGRIIEVAAMVRYVETDGATYDDCCLCLVRSESNMIGRVVQDVVTEPVSKEAFIVGTKGVVRWVNGYTAGGDAVIISRRGSEPKVIEVPKSRSDDFIWELQHIDASLSPNAPPSPLSLDRGLQTMLVIAAAHKSEQTGHRVKIDYSKGTTLAALS